MIFNKLIPVFLGIALSITVSTARADAPLPLISQTNVFRADPVESSKGHRVIGTVTSAHRDGDTAHYFASDDNCAAYVANPKAFPDAGEPTKLAFYGADPVTRFPFGVFNSALGPVVPGDPTRFAALYKGATYTFVFEANMLAFKADPARYVPPVGGYCLGAMSMDYVTPGDPRNVFFVPEIGQLGMWAVFGSPNGPAAWAKMTPDERRERIKLAYANYQRRTGIASDNGDKIANLH